MEESDTARIRVVCRLRPLNDRELQKSKETCIEYGEENRSISVRSSQESSDLNFTFDYIFSPSCKQKQVYEIAAKPVITAIFEERDKVSPAILKLTAFKMKYKFLSNKCNHLILISVSKHFIPFYLLR